MIKGPKLNKIAAVLLFGVITLFSANMAAAEGSNGSLADPMSIGVGARALGMGKAYVGMAEDTDALFMNPAGIARVNNARFSTMYSSLMGDVSYVVIGGVYPIGVGQAIGVGVISSRMTDIPLTDATGAPIGNGSWGSSVSFLSYATYLKDVPLFGNFFKGAIKRDILLGASAKYFNTDGDGLSNITSATGNGFNADFGIILPLNGYAVLGANYQNAIPASMGGKITQRNGNSTDISSTLKLGTKLNLIGKEGEAFSAHNSRKLYANIDYDYFPKSSKPGISHYGLELWPVNNLALRAGSDNNELTAGVGIRYSGVEFNYAYHPYSGINENTTHYFSFGYVGEGRKREIKVKFDTPLNRTVVYDDVVSISGKIEVIEGDEKEEKSGPLTLKINKTDIPVSANNTFSAEVTITGYGKKLILVEAEDSAGSYLREEVKVLKLTSFADVPEGYWAKLNIENNATLGLVQGFPNGTFQPRRGLTRAELAVLLVRARGLELPASDAKQIFKDVKADFWAAKYIELAQKEGLIQGYADKTFRPNSKITKAEGIAVLARFEGLKNPGELMAKPYWDVPTKHWASGYIQAAKDAGMISFAEGNRVKPKRFFTRGEAVDMLAKTTLAGAKIKDMYTWEKGFSPELIQGEHLTIKKAAL